VARPHRIWVVDDDPELRAMLATYLGDQGYAVRTLADGAQLTSRLEGRLGGERPDLLVLDLMLPGSDGLSLLRRLRDAGDDLPVLLLSARADDLAKPFLPRELTARIEAVLRRRTPLPPGSPQPEAQPLRFGDCLLDLARRQLERAGAPVTITAGEYALLAAFAAHPHRPLSRERLIELARGPDSDTDGRSMDVQVSRLRRLIEPDPARPRYVQTVWGYGYVFVPDGTPHGT
jgi:two-component system phosphate regulon response regulator OmpR